MPELTPTAQPAAIATRPAAARTASAARNVVLSITLALLSGCGTTGWDDRDTLKDLYPVDTEGRMTQSSQVRELGSGQRFLRTLIGPFGYRPSGSLVKVEDPCALGCETIRSLSTRLDGNTALIAFAIPRFAALALKAPYELTRAQAVTALATALDHQLPSPPPVAEPFIEDPEALRTMIRLLLGVDVSRVDEGAEAQGLPTARAVAIIRNLGETRYESLKPTTNALLALGYVSRTTADRDPEVTRYTRDGILRLGRTLCRFTLARILRSEPRDLVRGAAARAMAAARAPWGEEMLLKMLLTETEAPVLRKVYRALDAYRTPHVARRLLEVLKSDPDPLRDALSRRALLNFTQQPMGIDPAAWEKRLRKLGYLDDG